AAALLENWADKTHVMINFEKANSLSHRVRYEDLVADPEKTLDAVFQFLGLEWDKSMLTRIFKVHHDLGGGDYKIISTSKIEKDRIGKGAEVDPKLLALMPSELLKKQKELHSLLGYPLTHISSST
ncbi:MAG: sulfotransferase, partial [bacterium]